MARKHYKAEEVVLKLREADVLLSQGKGLGEICKHLGISRDTYSRWRREYGGLQVDQAKKLKETEKENTRLRKIVSDLTLDIAILKEVNRGNF